MIEQKIITPNYDWYTYDVEVFKHYFIVVFTKNKFLEGTTLCPIIATFILFTPIFYCALALYAAFAFRNSS